MSIDWQMTPGALWRPRRNALKPVPVLDPVTLDDLLGIDTHKDALLANTRRFLAGRPANNALLWGARGTGKSSLVKAVVNAHVPDGLRVVQVDRDDLLALPEIIDELRGLPLRFVVFCDDLSFAPGDGGYRALKTVLEGSIEAPSPNVIVYATSNRRHLVPEYTADTALSRVISTEIHHSDEVEEKISLADRFGLWLPFYPIDQDHYLAIIDHLFADPGEPGLSSNDKNKDADGRTGLHLEALRFAQVKGVRSGRTARQFFNTRSRGDSR